MNAGTFYRVAGIPSPVFIPVPAIMGTNDAGQIVVCAWCAKEFKDSPVSIYHADVTHGICPRHKSEVLKELNSCLQ